jgi:hypothetical protein
MRFLLLLLLCSCIATTYAFHSPAFALLSTAKHNVERNFGLVAARSVHVCRNTQHRWRASQLLMAAAALELDTGDVKRQLASIRSRIEVNADAGKPLMCSAIARFYDQQ